MKKTLLSILCFIASINYLSSQCYTCFGQVNISLGDNCGVVLEPDIFLAGACDTDYSMLFTYPGGDTIISTGPITLTNVDYTTGTIKIIGISNGNECTTSLIFEDKQAPVVTAVNAPMFASCQDDLNSLVTITATDNCSGTTVTLIDEIVVIPSDCSNPVAELTYAIDDDSGNRALEVVIIEISDFCADISIDSTVELECDQPLDDAPGPIFGAGLNPENFDITVFNVDDNNIKYLVKEPICNRIIVLSQEVTFVDTTPPVISISDTGPYTLAQYENGYILSVVSAVDACDNLNSIGITPTGTSLVSCDPLTFEASYYITALDNFSNLSDTNIVISVIGGSPTVSINSGSTCLSAGSIVSATVSGSTGPYTYDWSISNKKWSIAGVPGTSDAVVTADKGNAKITVNITDAFGCVTSATVKFSACKKKDMSVATKGENRAFPTLVNDQLFIDWHSDAGNSVNMKVFRLNGNQTDNQILQTNSGLNQFSLNTNGWESGFHLIIMNDGENTETFKVMKL